MTGWASLEACLEDAAARGTEIRFWWRDDDAGRPVPGLDRLLDLAERRSAPVALAVVAAWLEPQTQATIVSSRWASVLQHGIAHANHAPAGAKPVELAHRPLPELLAELERAQDRLRDCFGAVLLAVLVPPWNRIDPALIALLGGRYVGLSTFGARMPGEVAAGVWRIDTQLDPVDWHGGRGFVGDEVALGRLRTLVEAADGPIGVLTHHQVMDEAGWTFLDHLLDLIGRHPAARVCGADELFEVAA